MDKAPITIPKGAPPTPVREAEEALENALKGQPWEITEVQEDTELPPELRPTTPHKQAARPEKMEALPEKSPPKPLEEDTDSSLPKVKWFPNTPPPDPIYDATFVYNGLEIEFRYTEVIVDEISIIFLLPLKEVPRIKMPALANCQVKFRPPSHDEVRTYNVITTGGCTKPLSVPYGVILFIVDRDSQSPE